ncbi:hypothetical protein [Aquibacillus saliphilus]|uniref:hypothetical protein n=1 Tax=Aquibacillus saliphilus TaxID=1909422 RepID=UPI001CF0146B|nr:hypothetical protein [Aquibacillus saliphilus]
MYIYINLDRFQHPDNEEEFSQCDYSGCKNEIYYGEEYFLLHEGTQLVRLHESCYDPYIKEIFDRRILIAGVDDE